MCGIFLEVGFGEKGRDGYSRLLSCRGPDGTGEFKNNRIRLVHTRLAISDISEVQPKSYKDGSIIIAFNGELYGDIYSGERLSELDYIFTMFDKHGVDFAKHIMGEFSIVIIETQRNMVHITRDFFGTKPLFAENSGSRLIVSSIASDLIKPSLMPRNRTLSFAIDTLELISERQVFNPIQFFKEVKVDWESEFRISLTKMWPLEARSFVPLSSGHDSGLLAALLTEMGYSPTYYVLPRGENLAVLNARIEYLVKRGKKVVVIDLNADDEKAIWKSIGEECDLYLMRDECFREIDPIRSDPASVGIATIYKHASGEKMRVCFSGQGGDEIYSGGYGSIGPAINVSTQMDEDNEKDPKQRYPWRHLLGGRMTRYILKEELIGSLYGIEARYPLLALKPFVAYLKGYDISYSEYYKGPIEMILEKTGFPFDKTRIKRGFNPYSMDRSEDFIEKFNKHVIAGKEIWS